jgi:hypothetical protein
VLCGNITQHRSQTPRFVSASIDQVFKAGKLYQHIKHWRLTYVRTHKVVLLKKSKTMRLQKHSKTSSWLKNGRVRDGNNSENDKTEGEVGEAKLI